MKQRKAINRKGKGGVLKNKGCTVMQMGFLGKGESLSIGLFLALALLPKVNLGIEDQEKTFTSNC